MKYTKILFAVAVLFTAFAFGQADKGKFKEMRKEMRTYTQANILPVLKSERASFDAHLSDAERQTVADARVQLKAQKEAHKDLRKELRDLKKAGGALTEAQKSQIASIRAEKKAVMQTLRPILEAHQNELKAIKTALAPQKQNWKAALEDIRRKYISDAEMDKMKEEHKAKHQANKAARGTKDGEEKRPRGHHGKKGHKLGMHKLMNPVSFLLLDPNAEMPSEAVETKVDVYPNPVSYLSQISVDLPSAGNVRIDLLDRQGNLVKTVLDGQKSAGKHTIDVDASTLPANIYYYKVTTGQGTSTKKFFKK